MIPHREGETHLRHDDLCDPGAGGPGRIVGIVSPAGTPTEAAVELIQWLIKYIQKIRLRFKSLTPAFMKGMRNIPPLTDLPLLDFSYT